MNPANPSSPSSVTRALPSDREITELLRRSSTIAVVGLSSRMSRASYGVSRFLQFAGRVYRIVPVNPNESEVLGEKSYPRLEDIPEKVDIVDVFRRSEFVPEIVDAAAIRIGSIGAPCGCRRAW